MKSCLLAPNEQPDLSSLSYPLLAQPKYDGWRCVCLSGHLLTRRMDPQPNLCLYQHLENLVNYAEQKGLVFDGELYSLGRDFRSLSSILRTPDHPIPADLTFYLFDCLPRKHWDLGISVDYVSRLGLLESVRRGFPNIQIAPTNEVSSPSEIQELLELVTFMGYEGLMLKNPNGLYKHGRATLRENNIFKLKPFDYLDAQIIGWKEGQELRSNAEVLTSTTGHTKRTTRRQDHQPSNTLGSFLVQDENGRQFSVGFARGWSHSSRKQLWDNRHDHLGQWIRVRFLLGGAYDKPRCPQMVSFRDTI